MPRCDVPRAKALTAHVVHELPAVTAVPMQGDEDIVWLGAAAIEARGPDDYETLLCAIQLRGEGQVLLHRGSC
jgi:hypothetical protein